MQTVEIKLEVLQKSTIFVTAQLQQVLFVHEKCENIN